MVVSKESKYNEFVTLFSYCLRYDDGAAPNPYHGICTLVICKPAIRRVAQKGDWIVGLGGKDSPLGDISGLVIYAMKITEKMTMAEYDEYCRKKLKGKIPRWGSKFILRVGDCIFDFSRGKPVLRNSVHTDDNREVDLSGENALLSDHYYYFGDAPVPLPPHLMPIVHQTQGHKSLANSRYAEAFVKWIQSLDYESNTLYGEPALKSSVMEDMDTSRCGKRDLDEDRDDSIC